VFETFHPFSPLHAIVLLAFAACCATAIAYGRRMRDVSPEDLRRRERQFAWGNLILWVAVQIYTFLPRNFVASSALPLHVCDLASPLATVAMLRPDLRVMRAMLYYWGIGLCTQAFITPDLKEGPADLRFWAFWLPHFGVVGAAVYDLAVRRFRPGWRDLGAAIALSFAYALVVFTINATFGSNYGYLGPSTPRQPSAIDVLGPWPARAAIVVLLAYAVFALMTLPFKPWRSTTHPVTSG
jgi:hypothetical integral membrane protein (TIGR02206 family)